MVVVTATTALAQGWPSGYGGVMLQGFSWDNYTDTRWTTLTAQAEDMAEYIDLLWIPNAANCGSGNQMGYSPLYWFTNYSSSFGNKSELQALVTAMGNNGIGIIGDVVINHRQNVSNWTDFPSETYNGVTYRLTASDICSDDDGGQTANHLQSGEHLGNADTGDGWTGMRDLDHTSTNVQNNVKAFLNMLLNDLHYVGFRYDMVAGYSPTYTRIYNTYAQPQFSVGECWKAGSTIKTWIDGTKNNGTPTSAAFDFQFRYTVRNAINNNNWSRLNQANTDGYPLISNNFESGNYKRWAVTFVENHDTQDRGNVTGYTKDPIVRDTLAANAYMLAMPGTPCVFLPHWKAYKKELKNMIAARKAAGVTNTSAYSVSSSQTARFITSTTGSKTNLICAVGSNVASYTGPANTVPVLSGYHYKYFMPTSANIAWVDVPSGFYTQAFNVTLTAVSASYTTLVYTTDGTTPSASNGTRVASGSTLRIDSDATLTVALLNGNSIVSGSTATRHYKVSQTKKITVYLKNPGWSNVYFYTYGENDGQSETMGSWPGTKITATTVVNGVTFYYHTFELTASNFQFNIIFNNGNSGNNNQTENITGVNADVYYEITGGGGNTKLTVTDVTEQYTTPPTATVYFKDPGWANVYYYSWDGNGEKLGNWPGTRITDTRVIDGDTYFYHTFEKESEDYSFKVIFNNNDGKQTVDITGITDDVYYELGPIDASGLYTVVEPGTTPPVTFEPYPITIYFKQPVSGWDAIYFHAWGTGTVTNDDNTSLSDTWPGRAGTVTYIDGEPWYSRTFIIAENGAKVNVVINNNNNGNQIIDLTGIDQDMYYELGVKNSENKFTVTDAGDMIETITGISLNYNSFRLGIRASQQLTATVSGTHVTTPVTWTSSNPNVVTVTNGPVSPVTMPSNGPQRAASVGSIIYGVAGGNATVTASVGGYSADCLVSVDPTTGLVTVGGPEPRVTMKRGLVVIESAVATVARLSTPDGRSRLVVVNPGTNTFEATGTITIVSIDGKVHKLFNP
ncbi:MAG: starch-binding protein [Muribaculaceae bacterium]|nr:starch-binding protein [Muribaculaceae bacterium]